MSLRSLFSFSLLHLLLLFVLFYDNSDKSRTKMGGKKRIFFLFFYSHRKLEHIWNCTKKQTKNEMMISTWCWCASFILLSLTSNTSTWCLGPICSKILCKIVEISFNFSFCFLFSLRTVFVIASLWSHNQTHTKSCLKPFVLWVPSHIHFKLLFWPTLPKSSSVVFVFWRLLLGFGVFNHFKFSDFYTVPIVNSFYIRFERYWYFISYESVMPLT